MWMPTLTAKDGTTLVVVARTLMGISEEEAISRAERARAILEEWNLTPTGAAIEATALKRPGVEAALNRQTDHGVEKLTILVLKGPLYEAAMIEANRGATPEVEGNDGA